MEKRNSHGECIPSTQSDLCVCSCNWIGVRRSTGSSLELSEPQRLERGLAELEIAIRPFLARDVSSLGAEKLVQLQQYLSFRVMELLSSIIAADEVIEVVKVSALPEPSSSDAVFFCIRMLNWLVVLQFNDDIEFKRRQNTQSP